MDYIQLNYEIPEHRIFVFSNAEDTDSLFCTYNVINSSKRASNTISIHRKKETNTLYTVNALNEVIKRINNGILDKTYQLDWMRYQNSFILTDSNDGYRIVELQFFKRFSWN
jgi:hypothetical protein